MDAAAWESGWTVPFWDSLRRIAGYAGWRWRIFGVLVAGHPPGVFGIGVILKGLKVLCFDIVLQVFILQGLSRIVVYDLGTPFADNFRCGATGTACRAPTGVGFFCA